MFRSPSRSRTRLWTGAVVLTATALVAACSDPPTTGGSGVATGENGEVDSIGAEKDRLADIAFTQQVSTWVR